MKLNVAVLILVAGFLLATTGCSKVVPPGYAGIKVELTGTARGVQDYPIQTGRVFYNPWTESVLEYPTFIQQYTWTKSLDEGKAVNEEMCFKTSDFLVFCADVNAAFKLMDRAVPRFYVEFRSDRIDDFIHGFFRNVIRDGFTKWGPTYNADDINGAQQDALLSKVFESAKKELDTYGVTLVKLGFAHPPRPPEEISQAISRKLQATQDAMTAENQLRITKAEAAKKVAEAQGKADANRLEVQSLTPSLLQMRALEVWDGALPQVMGGNGAVPFIDLKKMQ